MDIETGVVSATEAPPERAADRPEDRAFGIVWELGFGVVLPVMCWYVNATLSILSLPAAGQATVFRSGVLAASVGGPVAGVLWLLLLVAAMLVWIVARPASALLAGLLAACALWACVFAATILPLSVIGLIFGIGFLGLVPFVSAWVCGLAARRAFVRAAERRGRASAVRRLLAGAAAAIALAVGGGLAASRIADEDLALVLQAPDFGAPARLQRLAALRPLLVLAGRDPARDITLGWQQAPPGPRSDALESAYQRLTGKKVEDSPYIESWEDD